MKLEDELLKITDCLDQAGIDYGLCGGLAVVVHGYPRLTKDIDSKHGLICMKKISGCPQEFADIEALSEIDERK